MMRVGLITFLIIASIILTSNQIQPAFAQSFFDDLTNIFTNLQSYFESVFSSDENNKQDFDVFRALGETISDWTDDFDEEKKLLKEQNLQYEREIRAEQSANEQKQRELDQRQQQLEAERLAKEQKQRELDERQRLLDAERLAKEQKQRELEQKTKTSRCREIS